MATDTPTPAYLTEIIRASSWDSRLAPCSDEDIANFQKSADTISAHLAAGKPIYGLTQGFGPLVLYSADSEMEQGSSLISHLGTGQGQPFDPDTSRLVLWLRLTSMKRGFSAVSPDFWQVLADLWNRGFTPVIPREGTVSASGDLQPLSHAALAFTGVGQAWVRTDQGDWSVVPAREALAQLGAEPIDWPVREALAFVNGTGVGLARSILNYHSSLALTRAAALLSGRIATLLGANPEHFHEGVSLARGQAGQITTAGWIREAMPAEAVLEESRPLQEPYSLRCAPQVLGAVKDQLDHVGATLVREATGCNDNPITFDGQVLHGGNFHAMPVGLASDQIGLALHMTAYLAERQINLILNPTTNGGLEPMLTPRAGRGCGLAGVQISSTSFVSRIRQLVYPASLTTLPTNGWNQDHVPMALNGANGVADALDLAWLVLGSLAVCVTHLERFTGDHGASDELWSELARISPPLDVDRPMGEEIRQTRDALRRHCEALLEASVPVKSS